jgi:hypothetical protein
VATKTYIDLLTEAQSPDPAVRQEALRLFQAWVARSGQLPPDQRLTGVERIMLAQAFKQSKRA